VGLGRAELSFTVLEESKVPEGRHPRWGVLGRSNVGKSTLLNALVHPQTLFYTGKQPGKTRGLIAAKVWLGKSDQSILELVDLPGFGYARKSSLPSDNWGGLADALRDQSRAKGIFWLWLADPTRRPEEHEGELMRWLAREPYAFVFTKADAVKRSQMAEAERNWARIIQGATEGPFWVSSLKGDGISELAKSARNFVRLNA
jgi:GTP-binding protein